MNIPFILTIIAALIPAEITNALQSPPGKTTVLYIVALLVITGVAGYFLLRKKNK